MAHAQEFDEIRKLRKGDDPLLAQGDWVCEIRTPQWARVRELCEDLLATQSKDLQVACWYTEAMTHLEGFQGLDQGLQVLEGLLTHCWSEDACTLFPTDPDERIARFEWLNAQLPTVINSAPMTAPGNGGYSRMEWEESRAVENLGLRDPRAREEALAEGKLSGEAWDKAASASGHPFYSTLAQQLGGLQARFQSLERLIEQRFSPDPPDLGAIRKALDGCCELAAQSLKRFAPTNPREESVAAAALTVNLDAPPPIPSPRLSEPIQGMTASVSSRTEAIHQLHLVAKYFRTHEPHSPVALLVERAARWGEMSLEHWLSQVIKDQNTLGQLHELLDLRGES